MFIKQSPSVKIAIGLCLAIISTRLLLPFQNVLTWDVFGYYLYLPAQFIYHDLGLTDMSWLQNIMHKYDPSSTLYQVNVLPNGHGALRYPCGLAVLNSPFFLMAHLWAKLFHFPADGFSMPYQWFFILGGLFYSVLGLYFFRKILIHFFDEKTAAFVLLIVTAGTNYFEQATLQNTLPHQYLFTLYAILIYTTIKWHKNYETKNIFIASLSAGLITITRVNEMVCVLIIVLWNIYNKDSLKNKLQKFTENKWSIIAALAGILLGVSPQLLYWKIHTGQWLYYSYQDPGVGFEFASPYLFQFLFSFRKGWFVYTPVMLFAIIGFYNLFKNNRSLFLAVAVYFIVNLYIVSSWSNWWYAGGSFSSRSLVSCYALLAIPFGYFIKNHPQKWLKAIMVVLLALNLFQTWQTKAKIISSERMTAAYYFRIFGKTNVTDADKKLLLVQRPSDAVETMPDTLSCQKSFLQNESFENETDKQHFSNSFASAGQYSLKMDSTFPYTKPFEMPYKEITNAEYAWIRSSVSVFFPNENTEGNLPLIVVSFVNRKDESYKYRTSETIKSKKSENGWVTVTMDYMTPEVRSANDKIKIYLWYRDKQPIFVDNFTIEKFEPANAIEQ